MIAGDNQVIGKFVERDWEKIIAATHVGMSTDSFVEIVKQWLATARHPRFKRLYIDLIYSPYAHADVEKLISLTFNNLKNACHI